MRTGLVIFISGVAVVAAFFAGRQFAPSAQKQTSTVEKIVTVTNTVEVERAALAGGMTTMLDDALAKCRAGVTSPAEALRVVALR